MNIDRRRVVRHVAALGLLPWLPTVGAAGPAGAPAPATPATPATELQGRVLAATWQRQASPSGYRAGFLHLSHDGLVELDAFDLPTRAHGLALTPDGGLLVASRRPGDWLAHWRGRGEEPRLVWGETRSFNGHVVMADDARSFWTTETDIETGASVVVRRRLDDLREVACWPTGGIDAHELLLDTFDGRATLLVANGGVPTRPETGRARVDLASMSSSLVRLDAATGASMGRWRLDDPRLSLRHMARAANGHVGIALQAEHDDPAQRAAAPVLAVFDGRRLHTQAPPASQGLAGYGGSIAAVPGGYLVSCTRAGLVSRFDDQGHWLDAVALDEACALLADGSRWWAGGAPQAPGPDGRVDTAQHRLDNHWIDGRRHA